MKDKEIVGLVEVDGEQHNKRIDFFQKQRKTGKIDKESIEKKRN